MASKLAVQHKSKRLNWGVLIFSSGYEPEGEWIEGSEQSERPSGTEWQPKWLSEPRGDRSRILRREFGKTVWFKSHPRNQEKRQISTKKSVFFSAKFAFRELNVLMHAKLLCS